MTHTGDRQILARIQRAFGDEARPHQFAPAWHCPECAAHDERLRACTPRTLAYEDVAYAACDPFTVATPEALAYFFPRLARFALGAPSPDHGWYASQLLFHLSVLEADNGFYRYCSESQRVAVAELLAHLLETRGALALEELALERFVHSYRIWSAPRREGRMIN